MTDVFSPEKRSQVMAAIGQKNTKPEMVVRRLLHRLGYRFRIHRKDLPGKPDIVFPGRRKIVLIHGCYWHGHGCRVGRLPKSRTEYWLPKIQANQARDSKNIASLQEAGWSVLVLWECDIRAANGLESTLSTFLGLPGDGEVKEERAEGRPI
jgi:DNA mismatch endonuclease (patch repair protein)